MPIGKATSSSPRKTVCRDLEFARAKVGVFFVGVQLFFILGNWGFLAETGYLSSPTYEARGDGTYVQYWFVPTLCRRCRVRGFLLI